MATERLTDQHLDPESLVSRIIAELRANPEAQRLLLRVLLTNEFLGMPARLQNIEKDIGELKADVVRTQDEDREAGGEDREAGDDDRQTRQRRGRSQDDDRQTRQRRGRSQGFRPGDEGASLDSPAAESAPRPAARPHRAERRARRPGGLRGSGSRRRRTRSGSPASRKTASSPPTSSCRRAAAGTAGRSGSRWRSPTGSTERTSAAAGRAPTPSHRCSQSRRWGWSSGIGSIPPIGSARMRPACGTWWRLPERSATSRMSAAPARRPAWALARRCGVRRACQVLYRPGRGNGESKAVQRG